MRKVIYFILMSIISISTRILPFDPVMSIELEKQEFYVDEKVTLEVIISCEFGRCILDTEIFNRIEPSELIIDIVGINHPEDNIGFIKVGDRGHATESFFYLYAGTYIGSKQLLDFKEMDLPPGKYELTVTVYGPPGNTDFVKKIKKKIPKNYRDMLYTESMSSKIQLTLLGRESSAKSE